MSDRLKIAMALPILNAGGAEQMVLDLSKYLSSLEHYVEILSMGGLGTIQHRFVDEGLTTYNFEFDRKGKKNLRWVLQLFRDTRKLAEYLKYRRYDVIHVHLNGPDVYCIWPAKAADIRSKVYTFHNTYRHLEGHHLADKIKRYSKRFIYNFYDGLVAVSDEVKKWVIRQGLVAEDRIITIPNGIDIQRLKCSESKTLLRSQMGFTDNDIIIVNIGSLTEQKNQSNLIEAIHSLRNINKRIKLLIIGDGPLRDKLTKKIEDFDLKQNVKLLGLRNDIPQLLKIADLFILPSFWEGLSIALLEAVASGIPVLASNIGVHKTLFSEGIICNLIDGYDSISICSAIEHFFNNRNKYKLDAQRCQSTLRLKYSIEAMGNHYLKLYERILAIAGTPNKA